MPGLRVGSGVEWLGKVAVKGRLADESLEVLV